MRLFGRPVGHALRFAEAKAPELDDLELVADAATLRRLASFLTHAADQIDEKRAELRTCAPA